VCQLPWDQTENYIRSGHRKPEDFDPETLKTITLSEEEGIKAITAKPWNSQSTEVISYLFSKEKDWTTEKAQQWFKQHEKKAKESFSWTGTIQNIPETGHSENLWSRYGIPRKFHYSKTNRHLLQEAGCNKNLWLRRHIRV
jgi:hypothetical protein